ncbi:hypothetical protein IVA94_14865 [Bradyrhizobium sp. 156]|uniref:phage tail terminator-like protein n=1 Tax=Bradyrhizobium sp. 156 TaxID=2782630 RepID=UPI001FFB4CDA|nr:phage tail terminator-like protein [Bradyrhizobium sp. 156]MCK1322150.1 hypothetical protein [Bradyrhizobium sp. 156]
MASKSVMDAVASQLAANWTVTPVVPADEVTSGPADGSSYVTVEYPVAKEDQITVGAPTKNVFRETGAFRIVLNSPSGQGVDQAFTWIDQLRVIFRGKQFSGVTTFAPSPAIENKSNYQAGRFVVSFAVPYYFDLFA